MSTWLLLTRPLAVGLLLAPGLVGCGSIVFGDPLEPLDAGPDPADLGPRDLAPDAPDLGPPEVGPLPDLGCIEVEAGPFPSEWPFPATQAAYETHFYGIAAAARQHCGTAACHAPEKNQEPLVPSGNSSIPTYLGQAIDQLWAAVPYQERTWNAQPGGMRTEQVRPILWAHASPPNGKGAVPRLDMIDVPTYRALEDFVALVESCSWAPVLANPPVQPLECRPDAGGSPPDAGTPDLGDGGPDPDAGPEDASDGGDAGAPPDAGPPDTGAAAPLCYCPLPEIDVSHCAGQ